MKSVTALVSSRPLKFEAFDTACNVGEEGEWRHYFVEYVVVFEGNVVNFLKFVEDQSTAAVLGGGNTALVCEPGGPDCGELLLLPRRSFLGD